MIRGATPMQITNKIIWNICNSINQVHSYYRYPARTGNVMD